MTGFERATLRWAKVAVILSATAAVFVGAQWCVMRGQLSEMQRQGDLVRRQVVNSQAALLDLAVTFNDGSGELTIQLINGVGRVPATAVRLTVDASQQSLRGGTLIDTPFHFEPNVPPVRSSFQTNLTLPWHDTEHERQQGSSWSSDWPGTRTFIFKSTVSYQDGFGDEIKQDTCKQWLPGFQIVDRGKIIGRGVGLYDCRDIKAIIDSALKQERQAEQDNAVTAN